MSATESLVNGAFSGLLKEDFVFRSMPNDPKICSELELLKGKSALLALRMFDPGRSKLTFDIQNPNKTFHNIFSQRRYGAGFPKGLSIIFAYLICLEENKENGSEVVNKFASKVRETAVEIFKWVSSGNKNLSDVRKIAEQFDNYGGYYTSTKMSPTPAQNLVPNGLDCPIEINQRSGHLIAKISTDFSKKLLDAYRSEIETFITEKGKSNLMFPLNTGFVVIAYKDELSYSPQETMKSILKLDRQVKVFFKTPYIVPVRGDNRYSLVVSISIESLDILKIRNELNLKNLFSEGRSLRYTFGAIHNRPVDCDDETLINRMRKCGALEPWMKFIDDAEL